MREFLKDNFSDTSVIDNFYCHECKKMHNGCPSKDMDCSVHDDKVIDFFIGVKLANYMIPFS